MRGEKTGIEKRYNIINWKEWKFTMSERKIRAFLNFGSIKFCKWRDLRNFATSYENKILLFSQESFDRLLKNYTSELKALAYILRETIIKKISVFVNFALKLNKYLI